MTLLKCSFCDRTDNVNIWMGAEHGAPAVFVCPAHEDELLERSAPPSDAQRLETARTRLVSALFGEGAERPEESLEQLLEVVIVMATEKLTPAGNPPFAFDSQVSGK